MTTEKQYRELKGPDESLIDGDEFYSDLFKRWVLIDLATYAHVLGSLKLWGGYKYRRPVTPDAVAGNGGEVK